jgi:hypothetical protein
VERNPQAGDLFGAMFAVMFGVPRKEVKMTILLTFNERPMNIISYTFLDADGNEIEQASWGSSWSGHIHTADFNLTENVDSLTIRLEVYEKIETVTLPFSLKAGFAL